MPGKRICSNCSFWNSETGYCSVHEIATLKTDDCVAWESDGIEANYSDPMGRHEESSPHAGNTVTLNDNRSFVVDDWYDKATNGELWYLHNEQICRDYFDRRNAEGLPNDLEVLKGTIDGVDCLIHVSEIA